ncbi:winged helix-turn-helix transcriptional regulator [Clostridium saccharoperbutylacetonicum]|uniref:winged helix-turn-helix transcriptional regulator n=1 Tax=Clostridium saccharoperbutylacetonicum TaxID=36745 RepID=UPI0039E7B952
MKTNKDELEICPISTAQTIIGGKWTLSILFHLRTGTLRFGELNRLLPDVTQSTLTKELRGLEGYQLIKRKVYAEVPPRVEYSLTEIAMKLLPVLEELSQWSGEYNQYVKNNKSE